MRRGRACTNRDTFASRYRGTGLAFHDPADVQRVASPRNFSCQLFGVLCVMAIDALVKPLMNVAIFQGLKPLQITEIARRAERVVYRPGQAIIEEDVDGDAAVLIVSGDAVRISGPGCEGAPREIAQGALLGEMAMLIETQHSSTVIARGSVRALRITRADLHAQMEEDPAVADHFVGKITGRLTRLAQELRTVDATLGGGQENLADATVH